MQDETMVVTLTVADLRGIVRAEIESAERQPTQDALIGLQELCRRLDASPATVTRMCREGLPTVRLGEHGERRWHWPSVLQHLQARGKS